MVSRRYVLLSVLAIALAHPLCALDKTRPLRSLNQQTWNTETGLPQNTIHSVAQSKDGYIWMAADAGLVRFNAWEFVVFDHSNTPAIHNDHVRYLFRDFAGILWIGTADGLVRMDQSGFQRVEALGSADITYIAEGTAGSLWVLSSDGVAQFREGKWQSLKLEGATALTLSKDGSAWVGGGNSVVRVEDGKMQHEESTPAVRAMCTDPSGQVWVGSRAGLEMISPKRYIVPAAAQLRDVNALLCDRAGRVWIGSSSGLAFLERFALHPFSTEQLGNRIHLLHEDTAGAIWVSTNRGLARWAEGAISRFAEDHSASAVLSMYDDREGNLWVGTEADGLQVLRDRKFVPYTAKDGLADDRVSAVYADSGGTTWVGTKGSGLTALRGDSFKTYSVADGLASNVILALADDPEGNVWVGTPDGLNIRRSEKFALLTSADGLADDFVRSIYRDSKGVMWVGTRRGLSRYEGGYFTNYTVADGLPSDLIGAVLEDRDHTIWIGTLKGLSRFRNGRFTTLRNVNGPVTSIHQDGHGTLWLGTESGLYRLSGEQLYSYESRVELPDTVYAIVEDGQGSLWLASPKGVYRAAISDLDAIAAGTTKDLRVAVYGTADGMRTRECTSGAHPVAWRMQDGSVWFSTPKGIAAVQPQALVNNTVAPPVVVERVLVDDVPQSAQQSASIPPGHSRFNFQFAALSFTAPEKVRYKYKLDGVDRDWVETAERRSAAYANLRPGNYTFHVIAANNDGVWNTTGDTLAFRVRPAFYQAWWFYVLLAALVAFMVYELWQLRLRFVRSRFAAVLEERQRIAREIHDTLAQGFVGISVQLELVSKLLSAAPDAAREQLDQARILVRDSIAEARRSIWNLRSADESSLPAALTRLTSRVARESSTDIQLDVRGTYHRLSREAEAELLKIAQEALANAVRHSGATRIDVELLFGSTLRLSVRDNGRGFDPTISASTNNGHYGLVGMRERAHQINAELTVDSTPGRGTEVLVEAELRALEEASN